MKGYFIAKNSFVAEVTWCGGLILLWMLLIVMTLSQGRKAQEKSLKIHE